MESKTTVHQALVRPILLGHAEPIFLFLEFLLVVLFLFGSQFSALGLSLSAGIVFICHPICVRFAKIDPDLTRILLRGLRYEQRRPYPSFYPPTSLPSAPRRHPTWTR